jgi:molybdopterin molybdotransferase
MPSPSKSQSMISTCEAETLIRQRVPRVAAEPCPIDRAGGRILRQSIVAERDQPPFDRVSMDGIVIRFGDLARGTRRFLVSGMQAAGSEPATLDRSGGCLEVMTGAVMPAGCDTVIPVEQTQRDGADMTLAPDYQPSQGQFIHRRGSDCVAGAALIEPGAVLRAPELAVIAANGYATVEVARQPGIAIIATGDELVDVDAPVAPWQVRRSNDRALAAMLAARGLHEVRLEHVSDERPALVAAIAQQLGSREVLILSGGVSMGQRDYVPGVLQELGVERVFHKIAQRPGKPMWFGIGPQGQAVFALPGNPLSALVCGRRYVLPAMLEAMGQRSPPTETVRLAVSVDQSATLSWFVPVRLQHDADGVRRAVPMPAPTSGDFSSLTRTDGFVELPATQSHFPADFTATYYGW